MKNHPNTEIQVVTENDYVSFLERERYSFKVENEKLKAENDSLSCENEALIRENTKLRDALCSITGQLEGEAEIAMSSRLGIAPDLKKATEIYRQLVRLHKPSPLGRVSKVWVKEWNEKLDYCYDLLDQARYDADDALVIVE